MGKENPHPEWVCIVAKRSQANMFNLPLRGKRLWCSEKNLFHRQCDTLTWEPSDQLCRQEGCIRKWLSHLRIQLFYSWFISSLWTFDREDKPPRSHRAHLQVLALKTLHMEHKNFHIPGPIISFHHNCSNQKSSKSFSIHINYKQQVLNPTHGRSSCQGK